MSLPECPKCGAVHDPRPCAAEYSSCDCCFAMYPNPDAWFDACDALDLAVQP